MNASVRVLVYSGDQDFICNWEGGKAWLREMKWQHQDQVDYAAERLQNWVPAWEEVDQTYGNGHKLYGHLSDHTKSEVKGEYFRIGDEVNDLTFLKVHDAGHMVRIN